MKPFIAQEIVSPRIAIHTTDGGGSVVLDQAEASSNIVTIATDLFSKNILITNDPTAEVKLIGGNIDVTASNGNVGISAQQILETAGNIAQSMLTSTNVGTVDPAAAVYNEFNNTSLPGLNQLTRVNINPDATGTTINSIVVNPGNPNPDGRQIWFQNVGTAVGQTLTFTNLSGAGTPGGLILTPLAIDYVVPHGGGVSIMFDTTRPGGQCLIRGV